MEETTSLKTDYRAKKEEEEQKIFDRFNALKSEPGAQVSAVTLQIMREFDIYSPTTVWGIRKRVAARMPKKKKK